MISRCGLLPAKQIRDTAQAYELYQRPQPPGTYKCERPESLQKSDFDVGITMLGCFDSVGSLGVPKRYDRFPPTHALNDRLRFHTRYLSPTIKLALHTCAIDERRATFDLTSMKAAPGAQKVLEQRWFAGEHGEIGGGGREQDL
jgi:uncharacterized protein (DUF2235 family)